MKPQLLIGAPASGSGKTTFTMGLLRALSRRGEKVQPYKCGPDYIDTKFHACASGRESVNLDSWFSSKTHIRDLYARYGADADACIVEGAMGLFDGYDRSRGSAAGIAEILDIPIVLVVGAKSTAYSVAALLHGTKSFNPAIKIAGVVFNQVASERHKLLLSQAAEDAGVRCFGFMPREDGLEVPSRHLGLTLAAEQQMEAWIERAAQIVEHNVDIDALLAACSGEFKSPRHEPSGLQHNMAAKGAMRIAVARDSAFNFIYRENIAQLEHLGSVTFFSPLSGDELPQTDLLYLPGGYPELFAGQLAERSKLKGQIKAYADAGGRILAECGGMIYLTGAINGIPGGPYSMCGVLPLETTMEGARLHLGYRSVRLQNGKEFRGHEFHYSSVINPAAMPSVAQQYDAHGEQVATPLYRYKNTIAGYTHLYWGETDIMDLWK